MNWTKFQARINEMSTRTWVVIFIVAFFFSTGLSMVVNGAIGAVQANLLHYLAIPPLAWMAGTLVVYALSRIIRQPIGFMRSSAIIFGSSIFLQCLDPLGKALFNLFQSQAAYLYVSFYLFLSLGIYSYALKRWGSFHWAAAIFLALANFAAILVMGGGLTVVLGG
jgi:hypothetical protein